MRSDMDAQLARQAGAIDQAKIMVQGLLDCARSTAAEIVDDPAGALNSLDELVQETLIRAEIALAFLSGQRIEQPANSKPTLDLETEG